jgi:hypothetical protein
MSSWDTMTADEYAEIHAEAEKLPKATPEQLGRQIDAIRTRGCTGSRRRRPPGQNGRRAGPHVGPLALT